MFNPVIIILLRTSSLIIYTKNYFCREYMISLKKHIITTFLYLLSFSAAAHTPIDLTISESAVYSFRYAPENTANLNNHFIKEIARYNYLNLYTARYFLDYELEVRIIEKDSGTFRIETLMTKKQMDGDIFYEKFDLSQALIPSGYNFDMIFDQDGKNQQMSLSGFSTKKENPSRTIQHATHRAGANLKVSIANVSFFYAEEDKKIFEQHILAINEFLAFYELLQFNLDKADRLNIEESDNILSDFLKIYDLQRFQQLLQGYPSHLNIPDVYRFDFEEKQLLLESQIRRLNNLLFQKTDTPALISPDTFSEGCIALIKLQNNYLRAMAQTNHLLEPVYLKVINFFETPSGWDNFKKEFISAFGNKFLNDAASREITNIHRRIYENYMISSDSLMQNEAFIEAVIFLNNAKTLCNYLPEFDCELFTFHKLSQAKYGIYDSYLSVAESAQNAGSNSLAYTYLAKARHFQVQNNHLIITSGTVDKALSRLAWKFVEEGNIYYKAENPSLALENFINAKDIYTMIGENEHSGFIEKQISRLMSANKAKVN
jgi:hypothetical protein